MVTYENLVTVNHRLKITSTQSFVKLFLGRLIFPSEVNLKGKYVSSPSGNKDGFQSQLLQSYFYWHEDCAIRDIPHSTG